MSKGFSHCQCDQLTIKRKLGFVENLLMKILPHFDIVKTVEYDCKYCGGTGTISGISLQDNPAADRCYHCVRGKKKAVVLYLRRFYIWRSSWIGMNFGEIYLHKIYRSDDDPDPHDHPWSFRTFVLKGAYTDEAWMFTDLDGHGNGYRFRLESQDEHVQAPATRFRHARHIHRVILKDGKPAWTLLFTSKYNYDVDGNADWRFITQERAVPWREYLGLTKGEDHGG